MTPNAACSTSGLLPPFSTKLKRARRPGGELDEMREYEIYLPMAHNDGTAVDREAISGIKQQIADAFGGYTHLKHRSEGAWRMGNVMFRDEVTIIRVLDDGTANFDMRVFKTELERVLQQESVLIVEREVKAL